MSTTIELDTDTTFDITGLTPGTRYRVDVRAMVGGVWSDWSDPVDEMTGVSTSDAVTAADAPSQSRSIPVTAADSVAASDSVANTFPGVPTGLAILLSAAAGINFGWTIPNTPDHAGIEYRIDGGSPVDVGLATQATKTGLSPNTAYSVQVRSYDGVGNRSAWSTAVSMATVPISVINVTPVTNPQRIELVRGDEYSPITLQSVIFELPELEGIAIASPALLMRRTRYHEVVTAPASAAGDPPVVTATLTSEQTAEMTPGARNYDFQLTVMIGGKRRTVRYGTVTVNADIPVA